MKPLDDQESDKLLILGLNFCQLVHIQNQQLKIESLSADMESQDIFTDFDLVSQQTTNPYVENKYFALISTKSGFVMNIDISKNKQIKTRIAENSIDKVLVDNPNERIILAVYYDQLMVFNGDFS